MRRIILLLALLASCGSSESETSSFIEQVNMAIPGASELMNSEVMIERGLQYCNIINNGVSHGQAHVMINSTTKPREEKELEHVLLHQASIWLCPG